MNAALKIQSSLYRLHAKTACIRKIADVEFTVQYAIPVFQYSEVKCTLEENIRKLFSWRLARKRVKRQVLG